MSLWLVFAGSASGAPTTQTFVSVGPGGWRKLDLADAHACGGAVALRPQWLSPRGGLTSYPAFLAKLAEQGGFEGDSFRV